MHDLGRGPHASTGDADDFALGIAGVTDSYEDDATPRRRCILESLSLEVLQLTSKPGRVPEFQMQSLEHPVRSWPWFELILGGISSPHFSQMGRTWLICSILGRMTLACASAIFQDENFHGNRERLIDFFTPARKALDT